MEVLFNLTDLKSALGGELLYIAEDYDFKIDNVLFDSRQVTNNSLFLALKGEKDDGHNYIKNALESNSSAVALSHKTAEELGITDSKRLIVVKDTINAFEKLANFSRSRINGTVIGITGSVGKTTTKDLFYTVLPRFGKAHCNQKSFNNHNGVLVSLLNTPASVEYAIFEMGMSAKGEMDELVNFVKPDVAVITNVVAAHLAGFNNEREIAFEKSRILRNGAKIAIINGDIEHTEFLKTVAVDNSIPTIRTFGYGKDVDYRLSNFSIKDTEAHIVYECLNSKKTLTLDTKNLDKNIAFNSLMVLSFVEMNGLDSSIALQEISNFKGIRGRNNIENITYKLDGKNVSITLVNGSYNAVNPVTFISGLELMNTIYNHKGRKVCIFGDMLETGSATEELHLSLEEPLLKSKPDLLITIGGNMKILHDSIAKKSAFELKHFATVDELLPLFKEMINDGDLVFIKSSNGIKTWKLVDLLDRNQ